MLSLLSPREAGGPAAELGAVRGGSAGRASVV